MATQGTAATQLELVRELMGRWDAAWAARDPEALVDVFTEDGTWEDPTLSAPVVGHADLRRFFEAMLHAIPDIEVHQEEIYLHGDDGSRAAARWVIRGAFREALEVPGSMPIAPTGDRVDFTGVALAELRDGKVQGVRQYVDYITFQRQIGMLPASGSRGERLLGRLQALGAKRRARRNRSA